MARLLIDLRKTSEKPSAALEDFIDPRLFVKVVDSAKNISGFDRNDHSMAIPVEAGVEAGAPVSQSVVKQ